MAQLRNLHWWTVEYGLIGTPENPKIYGAGLLSSIGESHNCLKPQVKKLPYSLDAKNFSFDITRQQPQLFVTPDFRYLNTVLNEYLETMALRRGGSEGLKKALNSGSVCTVVYSSGLQVSGKLTRALWDGDQPAYIGFDGPSMLACDDRQLDGHGVDYHKDGFGSPVGMLKDFNGKPETMSEGELESRGIETGKTILLEYNTGVQVEGYLEKITRRQGNTLFFTFSNCTVTYRGKELFNPAWGTYDMAVGSRIISAYAGPADPDAFGLQYPAPVEKTHHLYHDEETKRLHTLYQEVRMLRETGMNAVKLSDIWHAVKQYYPGEWLLPLELAELLKADEDSAEVLNDIFQHLEKKKSESDELRSLVGDGLKMINAHLQ
jgi:phenylalanine-4-hydroxylase